MNHPWRAGLSCAAFLVVSAISLNLQAATLVVTNTNDSGPGSLRDTVALAAENDQVTFDEALSGTTILLSSGEVVINKSLEIVGRGAQLTTISAAEPGEFPPTRVFTVSLGVFVKLSGMTLTLEHSNRGGIYTEGNLRVTDSVVTAAYDLQRGGAIYNAGGDLTVVRTSLSGTVETSGGGALYNDPQGKAYLQGCLLERSQSRGFGVGVWNDGTMTIVDTSIQHNFGTGGCSAVGGGIANTGSLRILRSLIAGNLASASGGGIYNGGELTIQESVIQDNQSHCGSAGIENHGDTRVINTTLYRNDSDLGVGGIHNDGRLALVNSTLTGNSANI